MHGVEQSPIGEAGPGRISPVIYVLVGAIAVLVVGIGLLLFSGDLFDSQPNSQPERDYQLLVDGLKEDPENTAVLMTLAETEMQLGREDEAQRACREGLGARADTPGIPLRYANIMVLLGENEAARGRSREGDRSRYPRQQR